MTADPARAAGVRLIAGYDGLLLDLDGVIYIGADPVPGAVEALDECARAGVQLRYVTNNASRTTRAVAELLRGFGLPVDDSHVATSATASAALLARRLEPGAEVLVVGTDGLVDAVRSVGLFPVRRAAAPAAVVVGFGPEVDWRDLAEATAAVRGGAWFVATNPDRTVPTARGPAPGNGVFVEAIAMAAEQQPLVVGKPRPGLFESVIADAGLQRPLVVGDRLDTDIAAAHQAGVDSLLVLTGVTTGPQAVAAPPPLRPTYIVDDLGGLHRDAVRAEVDAEHRTARCGTWTARVDSGRIIAERTAPSARDGAPCGVLAACALAWHPAAEEWGVAHPSPDDVLGLEAGPTR
jgi:HAD superfamily hydrolase (TIGR01450 family)